MASTSGCTKATAEPTASTPPDGNCTPDAHSPTAVTTGTRGSIVEPMEAGSSSGSISKAAAAV